MQLIISRAEAKARGLKRYFTGRLCKHGHVAERYVRNKQCLECHRRSRQRWARSNPERHKAHALRSQHRNPARVLVTSARIRARAEGHEEQFALDPETLWLPPYCVVTGNEFERGGGKGGGPNCMTIDRLVAGGPYTEGNVWIISMGANSFKRHRTIEEMGWEHAYEDYCWMRDEDRDSLDLSFC